jgi:hypothetical protein
MKEEQYLNHEEIVRRLNSIKGKTWKAVIP